MLVRVFFSMGVFHMKATSAAQELVSVETPRWAKDVLRHKRPGPSHTESQSMTIGEQAEELTRPTTATNGEWGRGGNIEETEGHTKKREGDS